MSDQADLEKNSPSPALFSLLGKIMESTGDDTQSNSSPTSTPASNASFVSAEPQRAGGDLLSSLLSNPEVISKLPQIMSMLGPLMQGMASTPTSANTEAPKSSDAMPASLIKPSKSGCDNRSALLYALKPYLKRERQEAIDYMVKLSKLGDILKSL